MIDRQGSDELKITAAMMTAGAEVLAGSFLEARFVRCKRSDVR